VVVTLVVELGVCWLAFFPRPFRLACCGVCTLLQVSIIATANYAFLNYLVLFLGVLLLDDAVFVSLRARLSRSTQAPSPSLMARLLVSAVPLTLVFYSTIAVFLFAGAPPEMSFLLWPPRLLEPLRIANRYGLFAVMTPSRYEIEFQGSNDGKSWTAYPFRYKPQDPFAPPGIYAPYQPRFEWNLWFASLGDWQQNDLVPATEERLLENDVDVLALFKADPFPRTPPRYVRAVLWQYWFTSMEEKRRTGNWWKRELLGLYAPEIMRQSDGTFEAVEWPQELPAHD